MQLSSVRFAVSVDPSSLDAEQSVAASSEFAGWPVEVAAMVLSEGLVVSSLVAPFAVVALIVAAAFWPLLALWLLYIDSN